MVFSSEIELQDIVKKMRSLDNISEVTKSHPEGDDDIKFSID